MGNYTAYKNKAEEDLRLDLKKYANQQKEVENIKDAVKRYREWGTRASNEKFFKAATNLEKRLERMEKIDKPVISEQLGAMHFHVEKRSSNDVIICDKLNIKMGKQVIFENVSFLIKYGEKVCLLGKNGTGKSTLLKAIMDKSKKDFESNVSLKVADNVKIGYLEQNVSFIDENVTVLNEFRNHFHGSETRARAILAKFNFCEDNVYKKVEKLSGGEKVRLRLAELLQQNCNMLILDEPTNHIDINTREVLEVALEEYKGTLIFTSHDRYFINKIANRILYIEDKQIFDFYGEYGCLREGL